MREHTNETFSILGERNIAWGYSVSCLPVSSTCGGWAEAHRVSRTLVVYKYVHFVPLHDTDTRICSTKINPYNGLSWLDNSGGPGRRDYGEGTDQDEKEKENANP